MDDVALVLDSVGTQRTAFFGTDLGGRLALLFAATYPERTAAVVAFCVPSGQHARRGLSLGLQPRGPPAAPGFASGWLL
jgi:pimeloyl-ACP methyl ester carboxylesterase